MKKIISLLLAFVLALSLAACGAQKEEPYASVNIRLGGLKGPTSMGMAKLLDDAEKGLTAKFGNDDRLVRDHIPRTLRRIHRPWSVPSHVFVE